MQYVTRLLTHLFLHVSYDVKKLGPGSTLGVVPWAFLGYSGVLFLQNLAPIDTRSKVEHSLTNNIDVIMAVLQMAAPTTMHGP